MPKLNRHKLPLRQEREIENMKATIAEQKEQIETQAMLTQYIAEMVDIYIPTESEETENEENLAKFEEQN